MPPAIALNPDPLPVITPDPVLRVPDTFTPVLDITKTLATPLDEILMFPLAAGILIFEVPLAIPIAAGVYQVPPGDTGDELSVQIKSSMTPDVTEIAAF